MLYNHQVNYTEQDVRDRIMQSDHLDGAEKVAVLRDDFGIEVEPIEVKVVLVLKVVPIDNDGNAVEPSDVAEAVQTALDLGAVAAELRVDDEPEIEEVYDD